ncbi:PAS domain-containing sensor histidine kinase [Pseudodesulfovibrio sediminis]|uniref:histidine kinase n=1 Tax=Pseudodesulfovibrio sediminis TaxID=2810563 RepID=A0ABN6EUV4_9BACT|nr:ATP-binding protein [Pseudodesulfovibrio sediminis]BCS89253.1 hypothetical protein PSDVSF_24950 [Pseudodesulfovibrio sediminis]
MKSLIQERLAYEIVMSIGNSLELVPMLREGLPTYLRKLNCLAGAVLRHVESEGTHSFETVYAIPKRMGRNSVLKTVLGLIPQELDTDAYAAFMDGLPHLETCDDYRSYLLDLPGFGLLLLIRSAPGFSDTDIKSLAPINVKLGGACRSCDANERLQAEILERNKAEEKYRAIVDNAMDGIYQTTPDGRYVHANPAHARMMGYASPEELMAQVNDIGKTHYVHLEDRERLIEIIERDGQIHGYELEFRRKDGSIGWMSTSARLHTDAQGNGLYFEGTSQDVTRQKLAEKALLEAKLEAERLSQVKSNLLSMVSHELRTPLTSILGFAKIIRRGLTQLDSRDEQCLESLTHFLSRLEGNTKVIITEGERLTELINNVLDLTKLEAGQYEWNIERMSVAEMLRHSLDTTNVLFLDKPITLVRDVPDDLPEIESDHDRLVQVSINLISNAAKFTPEGEVTVSAREEGDRVVVRVADSGIGVLDDEKDLVFETFRQLGNTLTDKPKGTGLGLPICKEIVEYLGGRIWLEDNTGGGSVFAYSLPVKASCPLSPETD